jgi:choline dehydrogenase-like flavoprotein
VNVAVVGSGFSGLAVARALTARGLAVTVLDVGETLDKPRLDTVALLRDLEPDQWPADDFRLLDENPTLGRHMLPKKVHFGSEYIYAKQRSFAPIISGPGRRLPYPTFAKSGFSNIWGAAVLAPDSCDIADWPVSRSQLEPYFREAARLIPLSGGEGTLDAAFPSYKDELGDIDPGPQGRALLKDLHCAAGRLARRHVLYGRARLAIHTEAALGALPCNGCGYCFTGCVRGSIFSTEPLFDELIRSERIAYRPGLFVDAVREEDGKVTVEVIEVASSTRHTLAFDAIFLAGGPMNTTRLLLRSGRLFDRPVVLKESQKFVLPLLRLTAAQTAIEHPSVTLASVFVEAKVPALSDHWIHVQIVPMNELIVKGAPLPGIRHPLARRLARPLLQRTMAAWCGMHSDHSAGVELTLGVPDDKQISVLEINLQHSAAAVSAARRAARHLFREGLAFRTAFVPPLIQFSEPGSGTHCGASFPMAAKPKSPFDTDILGRPFGWSRVFAVDASVLPSIPGTTLAFPVMANAYRIGTLAPMEQSVVGAH